MRFAKNPFLPILRQQHNTHRSHKQNQRGHWRGVGVNAGDQLKAATTRPQTFSTIQDFSDSRKGLAEQFYMRVYNFAPIHPTQQLSIGYPVLTPMPALVLFKISMTTPTNSIRHETPERRSNPPHNGVILPYQKSYVQDSSAGHMSCRPHLPRTKR